MPIYMCDKCHKTFRHKGHFTEHQNKRFSCIENGDYHNDGHIGPPGPPVLNVIKKRTLTPPHIRDNLKMINNPNLPKNMVTKKTDIPKQTILSSSSSHDPWNNFCDDSTKNLSNLNFQENNITIKCSYCSKLLKNRSSLNRHLKICKFVPITKTDLDDIETKIAKKMEGVLPSSSAKSFQTINNTINATTNNTNNFIYVDNRTNGDKEINLNAFGKEQLDFVSKDLMKNIITHPECGIIKLIEHVHFNKQQPENQNIHMVNKKEPYVEVFNGKKWEKQDKKTAIQNMITTKKDIMDDYFDEQVEKNIITKFIQSSYSTFSEMLDDYIRKSLGEYDDVIKNRVIRKCHRLYKEIFKSAELLLINNKKSSSIAVEDSEDKPKSIECEKDISDYEDD